MRTNNQKSVRWFAYPLAAAAIIGGFFLSYRLIGVVASSGTPAPSKAGIASVNQPFQVHDWPLTNQDGQPMSLKDLRGKAVLLFFGYTHCPDVCPTTLADFTRIKQSLGADASKVTFVFVSIDSQRDKPGVVKAFLNQFDPAFVGLTGDDPTLHQMAAEYGATYTTPDHDHADGHTENIASDNYFVEHTSPSFYIDAAGYLRMVYFYGTSVDSIAASIRDVMKS
jgi:protein SCO1